MKHELPAAVRSALAAARLAIDNARQSKDQPRKKRP